MAHCAECGDSDDPLDLDADAGHCNIRLPEIAGCYACQMQLCGPCRRDHECPECPECSDVLVGSFAQEISLCATCAADEHQRECLDDDRRMTRGSR